VYCGPPHAGPAAVCLGRRRLAVFRLGSVLFPTWRCRWRVFEERYLIMMANLLKTVQARFGVVLIERGHQLGLPGAAQRTTPYRAG
jgi:Lon protease-like protein